jgi:hypothetical protein
MKASTLILSVGGVAILCFACAPPEAPIATPSAATVRSPALPTCDATPFLNKVSVLKIPFDPTAVGANYSAPVPNGPVSGAIAQDLGNAFCAAPDFFKQQLLGLTGIYINPTGCSQGNPNNCNIPNTQVIENSWGYRERPNQSRNAGRYIATSAGLWIQGNPALSLHDYETKILSQLLRWTGPQYTAAVPDGPEVSVLAALAHEMGHVFWYDINARMPGQNYNPARFCGGHFFNNYWQNVNTPPRWRQFGTRQDRHGRGYVQIKDIDNAIASGDFSLAGSLLATGSSSREIGIYPANAPWASFFGAISPDEDFVETYKFYVLNQATPNLTSLLLQISDGVTKDIPSDYQQGLKQQLAGKISCIVAALPSSALLRR